METARVRSAILWSAIMAGFSMHVMADLLPLFWNVQIGISGADTAPEGLLAFMMAVSYSIPLIGLLCVLFCRKRCGAVIGIVLASLMLIFNVYHLSELFTNFSPAQLLILPFILLANIFLLSDSISILKTGGR